MRPLISSSVKRKRVEKMEEEEDELILHVAIKYAEGIDKDNVGPNADRRAYKVIGWVTSREHSTQVVYGMPNPVWGYVLRMRLINPRMWRHLHLEVVRTGSTSDPGTSTGVALVGKTRIPIPSEIGVAIGGRYGLVRPAGIGSVAEGHIIINMEITKLVMDNGHL